MRKIKRTKHFYHQYPLVLSFSKATSIVFASRSLNFLREETGINISGLSISSKAVFRSEGRTGKNRCTDTDVSHLSFIRNGTDKLIDHLIPSLMKPNGGPLVLLYLLFMYFPSQA